MSEANGFVHGFQSGNTQGVEEFFKSSMSAGADALDYDQHTFMLELIAGVSYQDARAMTITLLDDTPEGYVFVYPFPIVLLFVFSSEFLMVGQRYEEG